MNVMILALMHFPVDFICALAMFGRFLDGNYEYLLTAVLLYLLKKKKM